MAGGYSIQLTDQARNVYERMHAEYERCVAAGDTSNSKVTHFRMVDEILDKIIPRDPFNPDRALVGKLSNMFRVKKGRISVAYIGSSKKRQIIVLYISATPRKQGDVIYPYAVLTNLILSGRFDTFFDTLGVRRPPGRGVPRPPLQ